MSRFLCRSCLFSDLDIPANRQRTTQMGVRTMNVQMSPHSPFPAPSEHHQFFHPLQNLPTSHAIMSSPRNYPSSAVLSMSPSLRVLPSSPARSSARSPKKSGATKTQSSQNSPPSSGRTESPSKSGDQRASTTYAFPDGDGCLKAQR